MDDKQFEKVHSELYKLRQAVKLGPLHSLAVIELAREFYSEPQRRAYLEDYSGMRREADNLKLAHTKAARDTQERDDAWTAYAAAYERAKEFAAKHPLIHELYEARRELCNRDHLGRFDYQ
ncbi:hypothetical protein [Paraburkholderia largidicola]|uniref:Uncharacterized protein n=1 Tax=Paraburkholderia largidicola TaxID=3014751 RepID=A0A7I8C2R9_9BURK|nr:hypothetical protein [Paraburkholderia sp. PGU16]BCF95367.1 hypothetical protein PPGU16_84340 [Paraburkholderia sp. PGU16]